WRKQGNGCRTSPRWRPCLLGFALYFYAPYWGVRGVPGPPALPVVGHLPLLALHGPDVFGALARKYGPIFRFHLGRQPLVVVADPELCKEVGVRQFKSVPNRSLPSPIAGSGLHRKGLFFTRDERWSAMRNTIISLYQPSHLAGLIPTMQRCIERAADTIQLNGNAVDIDFSDLALKLATDVIGQAAFGVDFALSAPREHGGREAAGVHRRARPLHHLAQDGPVGVPLHRAGPRRAGAAGAGAGASPATPRDGGPEDRADERPAAGEGGGDRGEQGARPGQEKRAEGLPVGAAQRPGQRGRQDEGAADAGVRGRAHLRAPPRRVGHHVLHALLRRVPRRRPPGGRGQAARRGRPVRRRTADGRRSPAQLPLPRPGDKGGDAVLHGVAADREGDVAAGGGRGPRAPEGHVAVAGAGGAGEGRGAVPGARRVPAGAVRGRVRGGAAAAPVRARAVRAGPAGVRRAAVRAAGGEAGHGPPLPPLRVPPVAADGVAAGVPVRDRARLQARRQAQGHRAAQPRL
ncbi:hypothetical protein CFC21_110104, partial [Triticum aestivum]